MLTYSGRASRQEYLTEIIIATLLYLGLEYISKYSSDLTGTMLYLKGLALVGFDFLLVFYISFVTVRRFHDTNSPGWYFFLLIIPLIGLYFGLYVLCIKKGTEGANKYGPDPLMKN